MPAEKDSFANVERMTTMPNDPLIFGLSLLVIMVSGFIQGLTCFGFALVAIPLLGLMLPMNIIVPAVVLYGIFTNSYLMLKIHRFIKPGRVWPLIAAGVAATPGGVLILKLVSPGTIKILAAAIIIITSIAQLKGYTVKIKKEKQGMAVTGFISGLLNGSTSMSGPPVVLFLSNQNVEKQAFRANIALYSIITNLTGTITFAAAGFFDRSLLLFVSILLPAMIAGVAAGNRLAGRINEQVFKKLTLVLVLLTGIWTLATGLI